MCKFYNLMEPKGIKILVADDEPDILEIIAFNLRSEGYEVITATNGQEAFDQARRHVPGLIILDVMMPGKNGVEVCSLLRTMPAFNDVLIVFLTAATDDQSQVRGLESGADDYITKPISPKVLKSRVAALLRRLQPDQNKTLTIDYVTIDPTRFVVEVNGQELMLAKKEFELLYLLAGKPGKVFLRNEILSTVWGTEVIVGDRTIDVHIRKIRQKLGIDCITTVKGVGYKFELG